MSSPPDNSQPGRPEQLAQVISAAERYYESSRQAIVVYWDHTTNRYRLSYQSLYKTENTIEIVRIPK